MAAQLPRELYLSRQPADTTAVERVCSHATNQASEDVVAVAVWPAHVALASTLLFGTGVGVVGVIDGTSPDLIDTARRSVALGATEIALPRLALDQDAILTRLRSRLGPTTPVTVGLTEPDGTLDLDAAEEALQRGADYIAFSPDPHKPTSGEDITMLLALADQLRLGGVKITATHETQLPWLQSELRALTESVARLRVPLSPIHP